MTPFGARPWPGARGPTHHQSLLAATYGVTVLDLAAPPAPSRPRGTLRLAGAGFTAGAAKPANFPIEAALAGTTLLVAFGGGLAAIDVADPAAPRLVSTLALPVRPVNVDVLGDRAAVVGSEPAPLAVILDVSDPRAPRMERALSLPEGSRPLGVALTDGHVVVAGGGAGAIVLRLDD